jgi:hypothetical protein
LRASNPSTTLKRGGLITGLEVATGKPLWEISLEGTIQSSARIAIIEQSPVFVVVERRESVLTRLDLKTQKTDELVRWGPGSISQLASREGRLAVGHFFQQKGITLLERNRSRRVTDLLVDRVGLSTEGLIVHTRGQGKAGPALKAIGSDGSEIWSRPALGDVFSFDDQRVAWISNDGHGGPQLEIGELTTGRTLHVWPIKPDLTVFGLHLTPDILLVVSSSDEVTKLLGYGSSSARPLFDLEGPDGVVSPNLELDDTGILLTVNDRLLRAN